MLKRSIERFIFVIELYLPKEGNNGIMRINKIEYDPSRILGKGSYDTIVFRGEFDNRKVAIKRLPTVLWSTADTEKQHLIRSDGHENITRYYWKEQCNKYIYLALQLCDFNLKQGIQDNESYPRFDGFDIFDVTK